jgi:CBS domain-containing protein
MSIRDLMTTKPLTVTPQDSLAVAAERMWAGDCGCLPVVNDDGVVVAMVTDRDICMAAWSRHQPPHDLRVQDAMSQRVVTCRSEDTVETVEGAMRLARVRRVPVVDEHDKLEGIVSLADIVTHNVHGSRQQVARESNGLSTTLAIICERPSLRSVAEPSPNADSGTSQTAFDKAPSTSPKSEGPAVGDARGDARGDASLHDDVTAPEGFGPAPGGYGPASAPAGAHGGDGIFGAEGAGGGPGNDPSFSEKEKGAAE